MSIIDIFKENKKLLVIFLAVIVIGSFFMIPSLSTHSENFNKKTVNPFLGESATFKETGLPSGTGWKITVDGSSFTSTTDEITARVGTSGTYTVTWSSTGYIGGSESVTFPDSSIVNVAFSPVKYSVSVSESGLPSGTAWTLTFDGTSYSLTNTSYTFHEPNGNYTFSWSSHGYYSGSSYILVEGANTGASIIFTQFIEYYHVTFMESGLPSNHVWDLTFNSNSYTLTNTSMTFHDLKNGTYSYSSSTTNPYYNSPSSGSVTISGSDQSVTQTFTLVTYSVTFTESGLPSNHVWDLTFNSNSYTVTADTYTISDLGNGTYSYSSTTTNPYYIPPSSGSVTISGSDQSVTQTFTLVTYNITFQESGLALGTSWTLTFNGNSYTLTNTSYTFHNLNNGTYSYSSSVPGRSGSSGSVVVDGSDVLQSITFPTLYRIVFVPGGLPEGTAWVLVFNGTTYNLNGVFSIYVTAGTYDYSWSAVGFQGGTGTITEG